MGREIGKVIEVRGTSVKAELKELMPPYLIENGRTVVAPRINTFVKTKVGLDTIICQISGEYSDETHKGKLSGLFLELIVKGYIESGRFVQGIRLLPFVGASVELLSESDLSVIYKNDSEASFVVGNDLYNQSQKVRLSFNSIIPSHVGMFGNTGSGKSNTLTKLLYSYSPLLYENKNGKIIVFDINNEYGHDSICGAENKTIYCLSTNAGGSSTKIPLDIDALTEDNWCVMLNATEATQRPVIKSAYSEDRSAIDYANEIKAMIKSRQRALFYSTRYNLDPYIKNADSFYWHSYGQNFYYKENGTVLWEGDNQTAEAFYAEVEKIEVVIPEDPLDLFLFKLYFAAAKHIGHGTQYEFISPLLKRAEKLIKDFKKVFVFHDKDLFCDKPVAIVQLANVNRDMKEIIPSIIANRLFDTLIEEKGNGDVKSIINIVIDEAHNLLFEDGGSVKHTTMTLETFERIVKEGRKYGCFLWISSQRPSDISTTIISQMHNYFIHKLVNPNDISQIRKTVAYMDNNSMDTMTVLGAGECIVTGTGIAMPCFARIEQVEAQYQPNSRDVKLLGEDGILEVRDDKDIF